MFPYFETINWFAAQRLLQKITQLNLEEQKCPSYILSGLKSLIPVLKQWNIEKDVRFKIFNLFIVNSMLFFSITYKNVS